MNGAMNQGIKSGLQIDLQTCESSFKLSFKNRALKQGHCNLYIRILLIVMTGLECTDEFVTQLAEETQQKVIIIRIIICHNSPSSSTITISSC